MDKVEVMKLSISAGSADKPSWANRLAMECNWASIVTPVMFCGHENLAHFIGYKFGWQVVNLSSVYRQ